jgi:hypothetical protein
LRLDVIRWPEFGANRTECDRSFVHDVHFLLLRAPAFAYDTDARLPDQDAFEHVVHRESNQAANRRKPDRPHGMIPQSPCRKHLPAPIPVQRYERNIFLMVQLQRANEIPDATNPAESARIFRASNASDRADSRSPLAVDGGGLV